MPEKKNTLLPYGSNLHLDFCFAIDWHKFGIKNKNFVNYFDFIYVPKIPFSGLSSKHKNVTRKLKEKF